MINKKIYLDTNTILDFLDEKRVRHKDTIELIKYTILNDYQIVISEDMLSTIFYIDSYRVLKFFQIIEDKWIISSFGKDVIKTAINISLEKNLDLEDVLQCLCAKKNSCDILITNDNKFYDCGLNIYTAKEFLESI